MKFPLSGHSLLKTLDARELFTTLYMQLNSNYKKEHSFTSKKFKSLIKVGYIIIKRLQFACGWTCSELTVAD